MGRFPIIRSYNDIRKLDGLIRDNKTGLPIARNYEDIRKIESLIYAPLDKYGRPIIRGLDDLRRLRKINPDW